MMDNEVLIDREEAHAASVWCREQFGDPRDFLKYRTGRWCRFWAGTDNSKKYRFCFAHESDFVLFTLRWVP